MKKLQQNYTTPEQSKRLLKLGVPADSADCYINEICNNRAFQLPDLFSKCTWLSKKKPIPCWSVGRLIEINNMCYTSLVEQKYYIEMKDCNIDYMVNLFELAINSMDFSKLEE